MRVSIFFVCVFAVHCTDDASLMQQGVGIESGVLVNSVTNQKRAAITMIQDQLKEIPHQGKMRQMAIDSLMQSVARKVDSDTNPTADPNALASGTTAYDQLSAVKTILHELLNSFQYEIGVEMTELNGLTSSATSCNAEDPQNAAGKDATQQANKATHEACRIAEYNDRFEAHTACDTLMAHIDYFKGASPTPTECDASSGDESAANDKYCQCVGKQVTYRPNTYQDITSGAMVFSIENLYTQKWSDITQNNNADVVHITQDIDGAEHPTHTSGWGKYIDTMDSFWTAELNNWNNNAPGCKTKVTEWKTKRDECDGDQSTYETSFCAYTSAQKAKCDRIEACYGEQKGLWDTQKAIIVTADDNRVAVAKAVLRVICLIDELQSASTAGALPDINMVSDTCATTVENNASIVPAMTRDKPSPEYQIPCTYVQGPYPFADNAQNWLSDQYSALVEASTVEASATVGDATRWGADWFSDGSTRVGYPRPFNAYDLEFMTPTETTAACGTVPV